MRSAGLRETATRSIFGGSHLALVESDSAEPRNALSLAEYDMSASFAGCRECLAGQEENVPLRALIDGADCVSSDISCDEWRRLALHLRRRQQSAVLPCCGARAVPKTSNRGTQFFAHFKRVKCTSSAETEEHRRIKQQLLLGCRDAGWSARTEEVAADGVWRADVLARLDGRAVAFEIQWTRQSPEETERRQHIYKAAGVRGCWLFKALPRMRERRDVPAFALSFENTHLDPSVRVGAHTLTVREFASTMLNGDCKFMSSLTLVAPYSVMVHLRATVCSACQNTVHFADVEVPPPASVCGRPLTSLPPGMEDAIRQLEFRLRRFNPAELNGIHLPVEISELTESLVLPTKPGAPHMSAAGRSGFCPNPACNTIVPWDESTDPPPITKSFPLQYAHSWPDLHYPHWCLPIGGGYCSAAREDMASRRNSEFTSLPT